MGYIRNAVRIHAPAEDVFRLTNDVRSWPSLFTEYASSEVLEETENSVTFRLTTHPDESGTSWSWISTRWTDADRKSTRSERDPSSGPFQHMTIRWWYDAIGDAETIMTWEQEFSMKPTAPFSDEHATKHLNAQTRIQQGVIKERVEQACGTVQQAEELYRGIIVGRYEPGRTPGRTTGAMGRWSSFPNGTRFHWPDRCCFPLYSLHGIRERRWRYHSATRDEVGA